ncbi:hypothetical protein DFH08DRAFT_966583 [Mycena albidolilacea]|uniref:Uncharacterized protein n=1 Tax=Mycena albidolilacea TaxID=1033008 RepID=A0AAD6ZMZ2_9AGAR|nr:hypothetical protein DFH08DRAFT_966583 [Mycena albidolilacea]
MLGAISDRARFFPASFAGDGFPFSRADDATYAHPGYLKSSALTPLTLTLCPPSVFPYSLHPLSYPYYFHPRIQRQLNACSWILFPPPDFAPSLFLGWIVKAQRVIFVGLIALPPGTSFGGGRAASLRLRSYNVTTRFVYRI